MSLLLRIVDGIAFGLGFGVGMKLLAWVVGQL